MAAIEPGRSLAASAIARPRSRTRAIVSRTFIAPAAASAANSPTEWPTTKSGLTPRLRSAARKARLVATSAGCCSSVSTISSSGVSKQSLCRSSPDASLPFSNTSRASAEASTMSRPMPDSSEPWPGKQNAILPVEPTLMLPSPLSIRSRRSPR